MNKRLRLSLILIALPVLSHAQSFDSQPVPASNSTPAQKPIQLAPIVVTAEGPEATNRQQIDFSSGTSTYTLTQRQVETIAQGENTSFNQVLVRTPGVSDDTYGSIHFRNEDPYYRYYINGTLLPSGINGFSQDIDTRFVESLTLKIGALSAEYPEGNYGIVDIRTKSGPDLDGSTATFYGGSYDTTHPTFSYGGSSKGTDFYFTGSYLHNSLGLENPTSGATAIHDETNQYRGLAYVSHQFEDSGRLSVVFSGEDSDFQIPNTPGQVAGLNFAATNLANAQIDSSALNETQSEQTYYGFVAYQQTLDDFSFQLSQVNRSSTVKFNPDMNGNLFFNGVAASIKQYLLVNGVQGDFTWQVADAHTIRGGVLADTQQEGANNLSSVYATDPITGNPTGNPVQIQDDHSKRAYDYAVYAQDEWKITDQLTLNYGLRFEQVKAYTSESQFSPRLNAVYQVDKETAVHAGYARYFDPPQLLSVSPNNVHQFDGTTNAANLDLDNPVRVEKSHYFDLGVTRNFAPGLTVGVDSYYKLATDQIDDGQFGAANISSPYNYGEASMYGVEFSVDYTAGDFSAYGNFAATDSWAKNIVSSQFEFDTTELTAISNNNVRFDQQQFYTASAGIAYKWMDTTFHADALYGDGIRAGFVNLNKLQPYYPVNVGIAHHFKFPNAGELTVRVDALNLFDQTYVLNDGTGIGEGAVRHGNRRGIYGGASYSF